uniref:DNTTIP1_dimer domain-containing protein n=1 Tax=Heterorhabditis bacteriophora TaxID=37862 RepID=A0A1I7WQV5_HETBA
MFDRMTGNGNGNKMNMRIEVLEGILSSMETDGSSARIFQNEITKELQQIMDRHIRTTFSPAIENLKRNGHYLVLISSFS